MCDYSLGGIRNRLAVEGEDLLVYRFPTHSIGLASPADLRPAPKQATPARRSLWQRIYSFLSLTCECHAPAVCIPPGARLILKTIPADLQRRLQIGEKESVVFVQTSAEVNTYRDAVLFNNGKCVPLQQLREGMPVKVVSLGGDSPRGGQKFEVWQEVTSSSSHTGPNTN